MTDGDTLPEWELDELEALNEKDEDELSDEEATSKIKLSVKRRFDPPTWVTAFEFTNREGRRADCLALNTSASRNFKLVGFEFKASRSDWLSELKDSEKADLFVEFCDEWYVVAGRRNIVKERELPDGWGLLELKPSGRLYKLAESDLGDLQDRDLDRRFWAKFLRKTIGASSNFTTEDLREAQRRCFQEAKEQAVEDHLDYETEKLRDKAESFEKIRDTDLTGLYPPVDDERIEELMAADQFLKALNSDRYGSLRGELQGLNRQVESTLEDFADEIEDLHAELDAVQELADFDGGDDGAE